MKTHGAVSYLYRSPRIPARLTLRPFRVVLINHCAEPWPGLGFRPIVARKGRKASFYQVHPRVPLVEVPREYVAPVKERMVRVWLKESEWTLILNHRKSL